MSRKQRYKCIMCGRIFPEGQGIVITYGKTILSFHSNRCASKFFRLLLERVPPEELERYIKRLIEEQEDRLRSLEEIKKKKI